MINCYLIVLTEVIVEATNFSEFRKQIQRSTVLQRYSKVIHFITTKQGSK